MPNNVEVCPTHQLGESPPRPTIVASGRPPSNGGQDDKKCLQTNMGGEEENSEHFLMDDHMKDFWDGNGLFQPKSNSPVSHRGHELTLQYQRRNVYSSTDGSTFYRTIGM